MTEREIQVGQELPALEIRVTRSVVVRYAGASTDFNEIHFSDRHAPRHWPARGAGPRHVDDGRRARSDHPLDRRPGPHRALLREVHPSRGGSRHRRGTLVRFTGTVAAVADGVATVNLTATCGGDAVLGAAKAEVRID